MPEYTVRQGETTSSIAFKHGFFWETIWNHPNNDSFREQHQHRNVLYQGDVVFIPEREEKQVQAATDQLHRFKRKGVPEMLRIRLLDENDEPRADIPYVLQIEGSSVSGATDSDGLVEHSIPADARRGRLFVGESREEVYPLYFGHMDPANEVSGLQARLKNLGIYFGEMNGEMNEETIEAIREFQRRKELEQTGDFNEDTRSQLDALHHS